MGSLQVAQIIADLQTLQNADPSAATALLHANRNLVTQNALHKSRTATLSESSKSDKLGRKAMSRSTSSLSSPSINTLEHSTSQSGMLAPQYAKDEDMQRAITLLELVEMRGKLKQMGDAGLARAKARVDDVVTRYAQMELEEKEKSAMARHIQSQS